MLKFLSYLNVTRIWKFVLSVSANRHNNLLYRVLQKFRFISADIKRLQTATLDKTDDRTGRLRWAGETL